MMKGNQTTTLARLRDTMLFEFFSGQILVFMSVVQSKSTLSRLHDTIISKSFSGGIHKNTKGQEPFKSNFLSFKSPN